MIKRILKSMQIITYRDRQREGVHVRFQRQCGEQGRWNRVRKGRPHYQKPQERMLWWQRCETAAGSASVTQMVPGSTLLFNKMLACELATFCS